MKKTPPAQPAETATVDLKAAAAACFDANPDADEFHQTSDGQCFADEAFAKRHAKEVGDGSVKTVTREEAEAATEEAPEA